MYEAPENINEITSRDEIQSATDAALDAFNALNISEDSSDEDLDQAEAIRDIIRDLRARDAELVEAAEARAERVAALAEVNAQPETPETPEVPETPEAETPAAEAEEAPAVEAETPAPTPEVETPAVETPEPVLASGEATPASNPVARAAAAAPEVIVPEQPSVSLIAAADVPGYSNGQELEGMEAVTAAILSRTQGLPNTNLATAAGGVRQRYGAALIRKRGFDSELVQAREGGRDLELVYAASNRDRIAGDSLVAAGGWCAPSETLYDICSFETVEGILSLPEVQVNRGGLRWTPGPDFSDIYAACGFVQTEAEAIAGDCKDCCMVDCPAFDEIRLDAIGLCVKSPLLTETAYPELTQRFVEGALVAHQHKVNKYILDAMVLGAGTATVAADQGSLTKTLEALTLQAIGMRYEYRMSQTAEIEVALPFYVKELLKIDQALENDRDANSVSDAEIMSWFTNRNLAPQFVYDFQDPTIEADHDVVIPATVDALMYPAGSWVKGSKDVINVDAVYDSPNLEANQYTALFVEEGILAVQKCTHTRAVTLPICVSGKGVLDDIDVCVVAPAVA